MSQKRILKELSLIDKLIEEYLPNFSVYQIGHTDKIENLGLFSKNGELLLEIKLNDSYPFRVPDLLIPYSNYYKKYEIWCSKIINFYNLNSSISEFNEKLLNAYIFTHINIPIANKYFDQVPTNKTCLCCNSLTCGHKWSPSCRIFDLCMEFKCIKTFETYLKPQTYKIIKKIFNNEKWIITDDIQLHILKFII